MNWYLAVVKQYAVFQGRAGREEYWRFSLIHALIWLALTIIDALSGHLSVEAGVGLLSGIYCLAVLLPCIAVSVRRLHDTDRSGWWMLIGLIPVVGLILLFVFTAQDGRPEPNRFGASPKPAMA